MPRDIDIKMFPWQFVEQMFFHFIINVFTAQSNVDYYSRQKVLFSSYN